MSGWLKQSALTWLGRLHVWIAQAHVKLHESEFDGSGVDPSLLHAIAKREVDAIHETIIHSLEWHKDEAQILTDRLTRRYDVGMAMNEATQRAMVARETAGTAHDVLPLSNRQNAALVFQQEFLKRNQERGAR